MGAARWAGVALLLAALAAAMVWSVRLGLSDYWFNQQSVSATEKAIRATPHQAVDYELLSFLLQDDNPARSRQALEQAVALNPYDAKSWIDLGLELDQEGDTAGAEQDLLRAAAINRLYLPKWSLANFYFRHHQPEKFWFWARQAAAMVYGDPTPLFRLCWSMNEDPNVIARKLDIQRPDIQADYVNFLIAQNHLEALPAAGRKLLAWNRSEDTPLLLAVCDQLIATRDGEGAADIWNAMTQAQRIPFKPLAPQLGQSLTNGTFAVPPTSHGFDWQLPNVPGVNASLEERPSGLRLTFSGQQPENCEPLAEWMPVEANTRYRLQYAYRTNGIAPGTGLAWRVLDAKGAQLGIQSGSLSSESEQAGEFTFLTPAGCRLARLALIYQRAAGTTRIEGYLILRNVELAKL